MAGLSTHVLDTSTGSPACGIKICLYRKEADGYSLIKETLTNHDGRTDVPLLTPDTMTPGHYQLLFSVGDYFSDVYADSTVPFLDEVPINFGVSNSDDHYHIPLLISPYSYSTYRGS